MAKSATKASAGTTTPVMVNKGLPWMFILVGLGILLLALLGAWSSLSGAADSILPSFSIFWLLGLIFLIIGGWRLRKWKIWTGLLFILLALVMFQIPGTTSGSKLEEKVTGAPAYIAEKTGNLLVTGTTKSPADLAAEQKAADDKKVADAASDAKASVAAEVAATREYEDSLIDASVRPCVHLYTDELNCEKVTFGAYTKYDRKTLDPVGDTPETKVQFCIIADPGEPTVTRTDLGGGQHRYTGTPGLTVLFFDAPEGKYGC